MDDLISRQAAIDLVESFYKIDKSVLNLMTFNLKQLPSAQPRHKVRFGDADHVWIDGKQYISLQRFGEAVKDAQSQRIKGRMNDFISRREAIDALWKALYAYEDKTEKQFQESDELDVSDWIEHRIFVQNMSDIDRQTILALPSAQPERLTDDDFETIRIHLNAYKEKLCNQQRWEEAEEYQRIIDRFMAFASAQPEPQWIPCSKRLPEDYEDVLVWFEYFRYGDYNRLYQTHGIGDYSSEYDSWMINHESGWSKLRVFAWMPLPEPWKGEQP